MNNIIDREPKKRNIHLFEETGSTNAKALELARNGAAHGTVVIAKKQTKGRGRYSREWYSPEGNLYMSVILRPDEVLKDSLPQLSFVAAVACRDALEEAGLPGVQFKWPNDLLMKGRKFGGILLEYFAGDNVLILGIGINIKHFPSDVPFPATCLEAEGFVMPAEDLLHLILPDFERRYDEWHAGAFEAIRQVWLLHAAHKGDEITIRLPNKEVTGVFKGLDKAGGLLIEKEGKQETLLAGDVMFAKGN